MKYIIKGIHFVGIILFLTISNNVGVNAINQANTNATEIVGQPDFDTNLSYKYGLWYPYSLIQIGSRLFISEQGPCRVSVHDIAPIANYEPANYVLGEPNINVQCINYSNPTIDSISQTRSLTSNGIKLIVSDAGNNRILIWNTIPTTNAVPANVVLGQPNFTSNTANNGGLSASSINAWTGSAPNSSLGGVAYTLMVSNYTMQTT